MTTSANPTLCDDETSLEVRTELLATLTRSFRLIGRVLWTGGSLIGGDRVAGKSPFDYGSDATVGIGIVAQTAGELTAGALLLLEHGNEYGAAALLRQLVEVEYLAWAFAEDEEEAANWLRATNDERKRSWQPRHMREKSGGRFRGSDYGWHCKMGGHPTKEGARLLPDHTPWPSFWATVDLATHGSSIWEYLTVALDRIGYEWVLEKDELASVDPAIAEWRQNDVVRAQLATIIEPDDG